MNATQTKESEMKNEMTDAYWALDDEDRYQVDQFYAWACANGQRKDCEYLEKEYGY